MKENTDGVELHIREVMNKQDKYGGQGKGNNNEKRKKHTHTKKIEMKNEYLEACLERWKSALLLHWLCKKALQAITRQIAQHCSNATQIGFMEFIL